MANVKLSFYDPQSMNDLQVTVSDNIDGIKFFLREGNPGGEEVNSMIVLDVDTAVKFSKELRRQIAMVKDNQIKPECNE